MPPYVKNRSIPPERGTAPGRPRPGTAATEKNAGEHGLNAGRIAAFEAKSE